MPQKAQAQADPGASGNMELGARLRSARAKIGMTRKDLARASGASERYLSHLEAGDGNPSLNVLADLAQALDLAVADLLPLGGERSAEQAQAAAMLRRLPPERLETVMDWLQKTAVHSSRKGRRIVLIGLRGAGKTALGAALADRLGVPFIELSKEVEKAYGGSMGLLLEMGGQNVLRRYEAEVWDRICRTQEAAVIGAPGGIVADGPLYERVLGAAHSIWLQASPEDHMSRVVEQGDFRPMAISRSAMADLKAILDARTPDYGRADAHLNTSAQDFDQTVRLLEDVARGLLDVKTAI
ncbi:shikimate kinase [Govanella unica]|uniref:Shikimate kinase n=1 Tax=Govanella unica TaxID=2975056 RepID=A0A9X3Z7B3_9PROT|nr:helix-turn-helix domain-containing protein [Govania unica]